MPVEAGLDQEDWVDVGGAWWRSHFTDVPWSYRRQFLWSLEGIKYAQHPLPPHYQDALFLVKDGVENLESATIAGSDLQLNGELVGVKGAETVMRRYEFDVGIVSPLHTSLLSSSRLQRPLLPTDELSEENISAVQTQWEDQVRMLFGEAFRRSLLDSSYDWEFDQKVWDLDEGVDTPSRTSTSPDVVDLTDSELSAESEPLPSTPSADRKSYAQVAFVDRSGQRTVIAPSPAKALNASALSFIPGIPVSSDAPFRESSQSPYTSPTYEFHFPSLSANPPSARTTTRSLPPNLEKDEHGFYIEIPSPPSTTFSNDSTRTATPKRPSASLLPAFLAEASSSARNRHTSKTRVIVDRLRSSATSTTSDPSRRPKKTDSPSKRRVEDQVLIKDSEADVFVDPMSNIDGWITSIENEAIAAGLPVYDDSWIESPSKSHRPEKTRSHKRSGSSISSLAPTTPLSSASSSATSFSSPASAANFVLPNTSPKHATFPAQAFYPFAASYAASAYPSGTYSNVSSSQAQAQAYFQMQYQMQLQAQAQWQMQMQANARMQSGMAQGYSMYQSPVPAPPHPSPAANSLTHSRTKSLPYTEPKRITVPITGVAGIRHA